MATQLTVRLPEDMDRALVALARRSGLKRSDIVRAALERFLDAGAGVDTGRPADLVRDLLGMARSGRARRTSRRALIERIRKHAVRPA